MKILIVGDVVGKSGRQALLSNLPYLRDQLKLDFVVVNGENAAHGFGITDKICTSFYEVGVDVITTGNHVWDQREIMNYIDGDGRLLRPLNYPDGTPGKGTGTYKLDDGRKVLVIHPMCRLFMDPLDDPFACTEDALKSFTLCDNVAAILVDVHGEASSEKQSLAHVLDGRVSAVVGTHTHVPTADHQILPGGTAFVTDLGMSGDYNSIIGMQKKNASARFTTKLPQGRLQPADGEATLCAAYIETDDESGLATRIEPVMRGGCLRQYMPI
ncbi:MAG: metallophosphoesterase [Magnetovibrio sp.]|nr:metallophosphoesterase [Magnetovibrio sp.]